MIFEFNCVVCGKRVRKKRSPANTFTIPRYCSQKCHGIDRRGKGNDGKPATGRKDNIKYRCEVCGKEVITYRNPAILEKYVPKYCSVQCTGIAQKGSNNPSYNGGEYVIARGYVYILIPEHPMADVRGYVLKHRLVMEKHLGRYLLPKEVVHHINGSPKDNRIENLMLFANQSEHIKYHCNERRKKIDKSCRTAY